MTRCNVTGAEDPTESEALSAVCSSSQLIVLVWWSDKSQIVQWTATLRP